MGTSAIAGNAGNARRQSGIFEYEMSNQFGTDYPATIRSELVIFRQ
jgi:hypothetical protein